MQRQWLVIALLALVAVGGAALYLNRDQPDGLQDGTYTGVTDPDARGNYGSIEIVIRDGRIEEADYTEFASGGVPKGEDYPYQEAIQAIPEYERQLIETQDPEAVDNIAGATTTWQKFKVAADRALEQAR